MGKQNNESFNNGAITTLSKIIKHVVTVDWKGELFVGIKLKWDYDKRTLDTNTPNFVPKALHKYQHSKPKQPQHAPAKSVPIHYGSRIYIEEKDTSPPISPARIKLIQDVVGTFAWYLER